MPRPKSSPAQPDVTILHKMLETDDFIAGSTIAETTNTSRASICGHLEKLRKDGFEFEAVLNRGYRIKKTPDGLHGSLLKAYLTQYQIASPLIFLEKTDSTNSEAERQIALNTKTPAVVVVKKQTAGRGRQGRKWESDDTGNLYASFAFKPNLSHTQMQAMSLWLALCACDFLKTNCDLPIQIKWPNDLILSGKKVSGFLAETRIDADHNRDFIFGIGLNINGNSQNWPAEVQKVATSLSSHTEKKFNINALTAQFIKCILEAYNKYIAGKHTSKLQELWKKHDALIEKPIEVYQGKQTHTGKALGIDDNGALKLLLPDGKVLLLNDAEVSLTHKA